MRGRYGDGRARYVGRMIPGQLIVAMIGGHDDDGELKAALAGHAEVIDADTAGATLAFLDEHPDAVLPLVLVNADVVDPGSTLAELYADPRCADTRNVVLTSRTEHHDLAPAIDAGHLHALVKAPASLGALPVSPPRNCTSG